MIDLEQVGLKACEMLGFDDGGPRVRIGRVI